MNPKVNMRSFHGICPNESIFHQPIGFPEIRAFPLLFTTISGDHSAVNRRYKLPLEKSMGKYACPSSHFLWFFFNWKIIQGKLVGGFNQIEKYDRQNGFIFPKFRDEHSKKIFEVATT